MKDFFDEINNLKVGGVNAEGDVIFTEEFEDIASKICEAKKHLAELDSEIKSKLNTFFSEHGGCSKVEGKKVKANYSRPMRKGFTKDFEKELPLLESIVADEPTTEVLNTIILFGKITPDSEKIKAYINKVKMKKDGKVYYKLPNFIEESEGNSRITYANLS